MILLPFSNLKPTVLILEDILKAHQPEFKNIMPFDLNHHNVVIFDLTSANSELKRLTRGDERSLSDYIFSKLAASNSPVGIGRYNEDRVIYKNSAVFTTKEERSIHLGIDLWAAAGTPVFAPLDGTVHSFANNDNSRDYGPTIILQHELDKCRFFTLYGHLSIHSLESLKPGKLIKGGELLATLGRYEENVHWPPHLHFQIIRDMSGYSGDYPGVASKEKREYFLSQCPDPNLILGIDQSVSC